jgi:hypothetical protein
MVRLVSVLASVVANVTSLRQPEMVRHLFGKDASKGYLYTLVFKLQVVLHRSKR